MGKLDILTILPDEVVARKRFVIGFAVKFGFLETGDCNLEGGNEAVEFILSGEEAIAVKLEDERFSRRFTGSWGRGKLGTAG